jgi:GxxExxY protein
MQRRELVEGALTQSIIGAFFEVYNHLGFGFLESVYSRAMEEELRARGHLVEREVFVGVFYKGKRIARQRMDMLVDRKVILENKATVDLPAATLRQTYSYLTATKLAVALVLHFGLEPKFYRLYSGNNPDHQRGRSDGSVKESDQSA